MSLSGKVAIVTGASSGIGVGIAKVLAKNGAKVVITARREDRLKQLAKEIGEANVHVVAGDICDEAVQKKVVQEAVDRFGKLDILVNNAGFMVYAPVKTGLPPKGMAAMLDSPTQYFGLPAYDQQFNLNLRAVVGLCSIAIPKLIETKGNIINISSIGAERCFEGHGLYTMSKAALNMLTKSLAMELGPTGMRVNGVSPGAVKSEIGVDLMKLSPEQMTAVQEAFGKTCPVGRVGAPEDIGEAVAFLADNSRAGFITGTSMDVDGGALTMMMVEPPDMSEITMGSA